MDMINEQLQKKIDRAIRLLQGVQNGYDGEIEVAYSGGKDSDVILQLAKESGIRYRAIHKSTTIDPPGTIAHVKEMGVEILRPKISFFDLVAKKGLPSRFYRFCCEQLKEYKVCNKAIIGVRKAESSKRAAIYKEPTECRYYGGMVYDECMSKAGKYFGNLVVFPKKSDMTMKNTCHEAYHVLSSINDACDLERMYNGRNEHQAYLMGWICNCINNARLGVGDFIEIKDKEDSL